MHRNRSPRLRVGRYSEAGRIYMITTVCANREKVFLNGSFARTVMRELELRKSEDLCENLCFVVMPDHIHWMLQLASGADLSNVVARTKGRAAHQINRDAKRSAKLWQAGFHDHALRQEEDLEDLAIYTIFNPVRAGIVERPEEYPFWWSKWHRKPADHRRA